MAYYFNKGLEERQESFFVETEEDISKLPTTTTEGDKTKAKDSAYRKVAAGSIALCIETGDVYILNTNDNWIKV